MAMHSEVEYVPVAMMLEEQVMAFHFLNVCRSFWILCRVKLCRTRTDHFCLHCPFCAGLAAETEILAGQLWKLGKGKAYHFHFETIHVGNASSVAAADNRAKMSETHSRTTQSQ